MADAGLGAKHRLPTGLKIAEVETAQPRDLDLDRLQIRRRTDLDTRHALGRTALSLPAACFSAVRTVDAVDARAVDSLRCQLKLQLLAHYTR